MKILPTAYLAPIFQFVLYLQEEEFLLETHENFQKQTYRNRCYIYGANGALMLNIPLVKGRNHTLIKNKKISYETDWRTLHWRSLEACYRSSPFFEYYEEEFRPFYEGLKKEYLLDFNEALEDKIKNILKLEYNKTKTENYQIQAKEKDYRSLIHPKNNEWVAQVEFPEYIQVFGEKFGFLKNLSIIDLLFNEGPNAKDYLEKVKLRTEM